MARHVHQHVHQHLTSQPEVDNDNDNNNPWPFSSSASKEHVSLKSGWSIGRANEEAYKAGYKGDVPFRTWLKSKKLDDRSSGQISQLGRSYDDGVAKEHEDAMAKRSRSGGHGGGGGRAGGSGASGSGSKVIGEVASALKNYGATAGEAREAAEEASKSGGSFDDVFKRALDMVRHKQNPLESGQYNYLQHADDNSFTSLARSYGLAVEGPSKHGSYLTKDSDGRILFWSAMRKHGRTYVPSVWTDLNVSVIRDIVEKNQSEVE